MAVNTIPFDTFIHAIDGKAEIVINKVSHILETGQSIIVPAHSPNTIKAMGKFKMLSAIIKAATKISVGEVLQAAALSCRC